VAPVAVIAEENSGPSEESVAQLFLRIRPRLRALLSRHHIPPSDAQDLLQEAFVYLLLRSEPPRNPEAWIVGTLRHRCYKYWHRRRTSLTPRSVDPEDLVALAAELPDSPEGCLDTIAIREALVRLSPRDRQLVHLRFVLECSGDEIGYLFDVSAASARKITLRALERLRRLLTDPDYEPRNITSPPASR
jgi:RNA polymerase sigma factor (sigma-70 family)